VVNLLLFGREQLTMSAIGWTLETHGYEVTSTSTAEDFLTRVEEDQPEICLVYDDLICDDVLAAIADARRVSKAATLVLTRSTDMERRTLAVHAGAAACVDNGTSLQQLLGTIATIRARRKDSTAPPLIQTPVQPTSRQRGGAGQYLTPRELEALRGLVHGESTSQIAARLGVRPATARTHIQNVLMKLGVSSRIAAVAHAVKHGVVEPESHEHHRTRRCGDATAGS
jgi:DNA-binding NarL/FixJ family response regulator